MRHLFALMLVGVAVGFAACGAAPRSPGGPGAPTPVTRLRTGPSSFTDFSGLREPQRLVVREPSAWREVWAAIWRGYSPEPPVPEIDFGREMLVVAALGERPTGGYNIFIETAAEGPTGLVIQIRSVSPGPRCAMTQAFTQPVDIARLPRRDGPVLFADRSEVSPCP